MAFDWTRGAPLLTLPMEPTTAGIRISPDNVRDVR
jgi:hypothetical protein